MADYEQEERPDPWKVIATRVAAVLVGLALVVFVLLPAVREQPAATDDAEAQDPSTVDALATSGNESDAPEAVASDPPVTEAREVEPVGSIAGSVGEDAGTDGSVRRDTVGSPATTTTARPAPPVAGVSYPTLPDGSPVPVLVVYDDDEISVTGVVQSEAARERLEFLALANSKNPNATISGVVTIDPTIPPNVGVRVVEMNSVRFPEGAARITPEHGAELDRVAGVMNALPNTTVLIIGHSDQRGSEEVNYRISEDRALAVANHLVAAGISPMRVSARAVGESDLLTLNDDAAALALNRRTEFVIYGLLVE